MRIYSRLCGWTLARAHARSGDRIAIAAYLGKSTRFDNAIADYAATYADQNERDHAAFAAAVTAGRAEAMPGVERARVRSGSSDLTSPAGHLRGSY